MELHNTYMVRNNARQSMALCEWRCCPLCKGFWSLPIAHGWKRFQHTEPDIMPIILLTNSPILCLAVKFPNKAASIATSDTSVMYAATSSTRGIVLMPLSFPARASIILAEETVAIHLWLLPDACYLLELWPLLKSEDADAYR